MNKQLIALKLGSTTTTIFRQGEGLVLKEPSLIATVGHLKNREIKAVGNEAKRMQGRTSGNINIIAPINMGVVTDSDMAAEMLEVFLKRIFPRSVLKPNIKALLCVPLGISINEKKIYERVCYNAGIADVTMIPAIVCSAIGENIPISTSVGKLLVNIGGGCTNIAAMAMNNIITGINISVGGSIINAAIERFIFEKYNLSISDGTSERVKQEIACLIENNTSQTEVQGINAETKEPETIILTSKDIFPILSHYFSLIADAIASVISSCPPDIANDIAREGIYVFGGHSQISGVSKFLKDKLKIKINISENGKVDILGAAKILDNPTEYNQLIKNL